MYIQRILSNHEGLTQTEFKEFDTPISQDYHSEEDTTPLCNINEHAIFRLLIGSANWCITLGQYDIMFAVNNLAQYSVAPRQGHLSHLLRIFGYLTKYPFATTSFDGNFIELNVTNQLEFQPLCDWVKIFPDAYEEVPPNASTQKDGKRFQITCYVNADHARNTVTWRSVTGILLLINNTPVTWISRRQRTVETSTFRSEVIAAQTTINLIVEMRYKL